ncbi:MAG: hypothetical protein OXN90_12275 [Gemmatimonadota bacterium]|nr:hypothetical protein [Gemmatimonadota bacterium]
MKYLPACLVALISAAEAQIALNADLYATYTDNVFLTASQRGDLMQSAYIDFDYQFDGDLSLYYSGNANVFSENADLFNHLHSFGASYARPLGAVGLFFSGASLSLRLDRPLYSYRDFAVGRAFASFEPYLHPELITRLDYTFSYQNFLNAADYSYREQHLDAQLTHYLPTRTTLQLNGELGLKSYLQETAQPSRNPLLWGTRLKAAQSLGPNLGLQLAWHHQGILAGQSRYADWFWYDPNKLFDDPYKTKAKWYDPDELYKAQFKAYWYDPDELFEDRYSYSGDQWSATLKYLAPLNCELAASFHRESRLYSQRPAYDLAGVLTGESTTETRRTARLGLARAFYLDSTPFREMAFELEWLYRSVASNDAFYDTDAHAYSVGVQFGF